MAKGRNIKGITIQISGDTTQLDKALTKSTKKAKETTEQLKDVERLLKLDPKNVELLAQKQTLLSQRVTETKERYDMLQQALQSTPDDQAYEQWTSAQKLLQGELDQTTADIKALTEQVKQMEDLGFAPDPQFLGRYQNELEEAKAKAESLKKQMEDTYEELGRPIPTENYAALQRELIESKDAYDKASKAAEDFDIANAQAEASAKETADALSGMADKAKSVGDAFAPVSKGAAALVGAAVATVPATDDLRQRLSMLQTNAAEAGYGMDTMTEALRTLYTASGDMDASIEALSNLLMAKIPESDMLRTVNELSGAVIAFPDTLKLESLADGLQETLATGEATGAFGELLERLGVSLETVNTNMAMATTETGKQTIALQELTRAGLGELHAAWETNNEDLIKSRESQYDLQVATAEFAETILPFMTQLTDLLSDVLGWFTELPDGVQKGLMAFTVGAALISPFASGLGNVLNLAGKFTTKLPEMSTEISGFASGGGATLTGLLGTIKGGFAALWGVISANPIGAVLTVVGLLIAAFATLYATSEDFRNFVDGVFSSVVDGIKSVIEWLGSAIDKVKEFFGAGGDGKQPKGGGSGGGGSGGGYINVPGYANGGVFAPNNPMIIGVGDNRTEREIIAPESALMETFSRAAERMGGGESVVKVDVQFTGSLAQVGRVLQPAVTAEVQRIGPSLVKKG